MPKNLAFFADGTWGEPSDRTNVLELYRASLNDSSTQLANYDSGLGTACDPLAHLVGGAFGAGLFAKIKDGYRFLANHFTPGDRIFLFGFSRGAYTVRSLAGLLALCGLPSRRTWEAPAIDLAFEAYRNTTHRSILLAELRERYLAQPAPVHFLGVWDTVGSLGIPALHGGVDPLLYGFLNTELHPSVRTAVQALAIDEERLQFSPALWTTPPAPGQTILQVWFPGTHGDVGGGNPPDGSGRLLSRIPLLWMARRARETGWQLAPQAFAALPAAGDALAPITASLSGLYRLTARRRAIPADAVLAPSVLERLADPTTHYAPANLALAERRPAPHYRIDTGTEASTAQAA